MYFSGNWVPKLNSWRSLKLQNTRLGLDWTNASPTKNSYRISYRILNFLYKFGRICNRSKFPTGRLASPIFIFRSAPQLKVHIPKCTVNKSFPSYSYLIAFFYSLFNLNLMPFPSSIQSTFSKHSSNPSLMSAILDLYDENVTSHQYLS